jgi:hypothetical protein
MLAHSAPERYAELLAAAQADVRARYARYETLARKDVSLARG